MVEGLPPIYSAVLGWAQKMLSALTDAQKLEAIAHPAQDAATRLVAVAHRLLDGDVAHQIAVTKTQLSAFQTKVLPLLQTAAQCADDAKQYEGQISELRDELGAGK
jgi:DNA-binding PucR family transcriptional regulator